MNIEVVNELRNHLHFLIGELKKDNIDKNVQVRTLSQFVKEILRLRIAFTNEAHELMYDKEYNNTDIDPLNSEGLVFKFFRLLERPIVIAPAWDRDIINLNGKKERRDIREIELDIVHTLEEILCDDPTGLESPVITALRDVEEKHKVELLNETDMELQSSHITTWDICSFSDRLPQLVYIDAGYKVFIWDIENQMMHVPELRPPILFRLLIGSNYTPLEFRAIIAVKQDPTNMLSLSYIRDSVGIRHQELAEGVILLFTYEPHEQSELESMMDEFVDRNGEAIIQYLKDNRIRPFNVNKPPDDLSETPPSDND